MNQKIEQIKEHFKRNKRVYIVGALSAIVSGVAVYVWTKNQEGDIYIDGSADNLVVPITKNICKRQINNNTYQTISQYGNVIGRPGKAVFDTETGKRFESETLAARAAGVSNALMSKHLHGEGTDSIKGRIFRFAEDAE